MTDKSSHLVSLLNFDAKSTKEPIINSPRSLEACRRQGISPHELLIRTAAELKEMTKSKINDKEGLELMVQHAEERRKEKIRVLIEERAQLMEDEKNGYLNFGSKEKKESNSIGPLTKSNIQQLLNTKTDSTMIEKEKKQLERIKQRQEKEIKQLVEHEAQMNEIARKQEEKMEQQREKDRLKELEQARARKETEERKKQEQLEKARKAEEYEEMKRELAAKAQKKEEEKLTREQENLRKRQEHAKMKEEEALQRHEEFMKKTEAKALETQQEILRRKEEIEKKEQMKQELLHHQMLQKQKEAQDLKRQQEEKARLTKEKNDEMLLKKKMDYDEKQERNEEKRKLFELERQKKLEESKRQAELQAKNLQKVLEDNNRIQEEKKEKYRLQNALAEERKKELEAIEEVERQKHLEEEKRKEEARLQVKKNMEEKLQTKINTYLHLMESQEIKQARAEQAQEEEAKKKQNLDALKRFDRLDNVQRKMKMDEYRRQKIQEKIENNNERGEKIKNDRAALLEMRQIIQREMQTNKQALTEKFEKLKRGKLNNEITTEQHKPSHSPKRTTKMNQNKSAVEFNPHRGNSFHTLDPIVKKEEIKELPSKTEPVQKTEKLTPHQPSEPKQKVLLSEKDARRGLDELKAKQNQEMLRLLEEEHNKNNQRENKLQSITDAQEKKRYEKTCLLEKDKSNQKIRQFTDTHNEAIRQYMAKYDVRIIG